jgi:hypothetical protein
MKRILLVVSMAAAWWALPPAEAQSMPEPLSAWPYYKEIQPPRGYAGLAEFVLDRETLDKARTDQADLRLYDSAGREIPYLARVLREVEFQRAFPCVPFNRAEESGNAQLSCDLGVEPQEHNEVEIDTGGNNFRRLAEVQGSADGEHWSTLAADAILFRFSADGRTVEQQAVPYPVSRYRYLRVRVSRDAQVDRETPEIKGLRVRRAVHMQGQMVPFAASIERREADRVDGRPASIWRIDLGGRIPIDRLVITAGAGVFSRPFRVEAIDDPAAPMVLASGELARSEDATSAQLAIDFGERFARRLKLTVTDDRNPPLSIGGVTAWSAARQVIFEAASAGGAPIRLYYGNSKALAPHYDLVARIPANLAARLFPVMPGPQLDNPIYRPEPKPLSERSPWLVYVVLAAASLALAAILMNLAKTSAKQAPAA